jgi:ABC-type dipeptide/oligopeptide/nickel transport system ATPase component
VSPLLQIDDLSVSFPAGGERRRVLDGVSVRVKASSTTAIVGESGSGKSMTALAAIGLLPLGARVDRGRVVLRCPGRAEVDVLRLEPRELRRVRGAGVGMVFQEPRAALNPVMTIGEQLVETIRLHGGQRGKDARARAAEQLSRMGIPDASRALAKYPHEFSGGMCQRACLAMALACGPSVLIADEPTTALDAAVRGQILDLLDQLKREHGLGIMLISHDLELVRARADAVCVMYAGRVVERGGAREVFANPAHPYTRGLLACAPRVGSRRERLTGVQELMDSTLGMDLAGQRGVRAWWPGPGSGEGHDVAVGEGHTVLAAEPRAESGLSSVESGGWSA